MKPPGLAPDVFWKLSGQQFFPEEKESTFCNKFYPYNFLKTIFHPLSFRLASKTLLGPTLILSHEERYDIV